MQHLKLYVIFILLVSKLKGQKTFLDSPENIKLLRSLKQLALNTFGKTSSPDNPIFKEVQRKQRVQKRIPADIPFPCNISGGRSETVPTSVHRLRPGDIDIIGAMGDSLTAGFGIFASNMANVLVENRGASAVGGGQSTWRELLTIPNILKEYNPNLYGYSLEDSYTYQAASHLNVGESTAMSRDLPFMANNLIQRMKQDPRVDIEKHWKMINLFVGSNDVCSDICWVHPLSKVLTDHKNDLIMALRILRDNLPRTIVSMIPIPNVDSLVNVTGRPLYCEWWLHMACSCFFSIQYQNQHAAFTEIIRKWQELDQEIAAYPEFQTDDFSVVVQTFTIHAKIPSTSEGNIDLRYLATDCFHWSQLTNAKVATVMWTNMFEPVGKKSGINFDETKFTCPSDERPYLATPGNS